MTLSVAARQAHNRTDRNGAKWVSLHDGDPGNSGRNEIRGDYYHRQPVTWDERVHNSNLVDFILPECTPTYVGYWDHETGGTFWNCSPVPQEIRFDEGDHAQFAAGSLSLVTEG